MMFLRFDTMIDPHFVNRLENELENVTFKRVDSDTVDKLIEKEDTIESVLTEEQTQKVTELFKETINKEGVMVSVQAMSPTEGAVTITRPEFLRRAQDMSNLGGQQNPYLGNIQDMYTVVVNANHPLIAKILKAKQKTRERVSRQLYDLALLQQNMLKGEGLTDFINRSVDLMG